MLWKTYTRSVASPVSHNVIETVGLTNVEVPRWTSVSEILAYLMKHNLIDGNNLTVTGLTLGENLERWTHKYGELSFAEQDVIRPLEKPIKETGHLRYAYTSRFNPGAERFTLTLFFSATERILKGNLAPGGAVAKITGKEGLGFTGKARTFDSEDDFVAAVESGSIKKGEKTVVVLRYLGPKGGPGTDASANAAFR